MNEEATHITQLGKNIKIIAIVAAAVVVFIALVVGIGIYNTPANRLQRQIDLGNKYLEEQNYEQAAIAFEEAIAIDNRCIEAYVGGIEAHLGAGNVDGAQDFYDRTLAMVYGLDADFDDANMEAIVEIYLVANDVYGDDTEKIAQVLEDGYTFTGEYSRIKENLIENYLQIGKKDTQDGLYEEALAVYDRLLELDNTNTEAINGLCDCLNKYIDILMEAEQYDRIRELAQKYKDVASRLDFSIVLEKIEDLERRKEWVEISPRLFEFKMMNFDLWDNHAEEIMAALKSLAKSNVFGEGLSSMFSMENDVWVNGSPYSPYSWSGGGSSIAVSQYGSGTTGIYGNIMYSVSPTDIRLGIYSWDGGHRGIDNQRGIPMEFEKFISCPIGKTEDEWYSLICMEQIEEKGERLEANEEMPDDQFKAWRFQTEWGEGYYYEIMNGTRERACAFAIDCSGQGEEKTIYTMALNIYPDGGIDSIEVCTGIGYAWSKSGVMYETIPDIFHIYE